MVLVLDQKHTELLFKSDGDFPIRDSLWTGVLVFWFFVFIAGPAAAKNEKTISQKNSPYVSSFFLL